MKKVRQTRAFRKQYKTCLRRGCDARKFLDVLTLLKADEPLPARCRPHKLSGLFRGCWECHIAPDWLLIYQYDSHYVSLIAIGSHADLFR